jgi:hypothetical protein
MVYFIIVVSVFIAAIFLIPNFEDRFASTFQSGNLTQGNDDDDTITGDDGTNAASGSSQEEQQKQVLGQSVQEEMTATGTTEATDKDLVIRHIRAAIAAAEANNTQTAITEIDAALQALRQLEGGAAAAVIAQGDLGVGVRLQGATASITLPGGEGDGLVLRSIIIAFSVIALVAVSYMFYRRIRHLREDARTVFIYLMTREAYNKARLVIKIEDEAFEKLLQEIEQYLDNGDWTLVLNLVSDPRRGKEYDDYNLMKVYNKLFLKNLNSEVDTKKAYLINKKDYQKIGGIY